MDARPESMADARLAFGPFTLEPRTRRLTRGTRSVVLRPKSCDVLRHLASRTGVVVSTDELLDAVWPDTAVTPQVLTNVIRELRTALGDRARNPRWLETLYGTGYILLPGVDGNAAPTIHAAPTSSRVLVGRARELGRLRAAWERALGGSSQIVFVTGGPGIGKTTLVDTFVRDVADPPGGRGRVGRGACVELHGSGEAYLPILGAIEDLATGAARREVRAALRRLAPTWAVQIPGVLAPATRLRWERALRGAAASRMMREGVALLRALATPAPVLMVLEDLQWSDLATVDLLGALARWPFAGALLVLATYRPADASRERSVEPLARELLHRREASEVTLAPFDRSGVQAYLDARFGDEALSASLAERLEAHSAGNPLFLGSLVERLVEGGGLEQSRAGGWQLTPAAEALLDALPESLRAFIETEIGRMRRSVRRALEAASVVGVEFSAGDVAGALGLPAARVEATCEELARVGRLVRRREDEADAGAGRGRRYTFVHAAYQRILYDHLAAGDREALHRNVATALEVASRSSLDAVAPRLATHFARAGLPERALAYFTRAATAAERHFAYREGAAYVRDALAQLADSPLSPRAGDLELRLGSLLVLASGYSTPEVECAFRRARHAFAACGVERGLFIAGMGLAIFSLTGARYRAAREHTEGLVALGRRLPRFGPVAHCYAAFVSSAMGELRAAERELMRARRAKPEPGLPWYFDIRRMITSQLALVLTVMGEVVAGRRHAAAALARSRTGSAAERAHAALSVAEQAVLCRDGARGRAAAALALEVAEENGLPSYLALARFYATALDDSREVKARIAAMTEVLAMRHVLGDRWHTSMLRTLLAEATLAAGDLPATARHLDAAAAHAGETGERHYEAETLRVRGECLLAMGASRVAARAAFDRAIAVARAQGARLWERRARAARRAAA